MQCGRPVLPTACCCTVCESKVRQTKLALAYKPVAQCVQAHSSRSDTPTDMYCVIWQQATDQPISSSSAVHLHVDVIFVFSTKPAPAIITWYVYCISSCRLLHECCCWWAGCCMVVASTRMRHPVGHQLFASQQSKDHARQLETTAWQHMVCVCAHCKH